MSLNLPGDVRVAPPVLPSIEMVPPSAPSVLLVPVAGPPGIPGPAGGEVFTHVQSTPAATWVIEHSLGRKVHVTLFDLTENVVYADVTHGTMNQTTITFPSPVLGSAVIS